MSKFIVRKGTILSFIVIQIPDFWLGLRPLDFLSGSLCSHLRLMRRLLRNKTLEWLDVTDPFPLTLALSPDKVSPSKLALLNFIINFRSLEGTHPTFA